MYCKIELLTVREPIRKRRYKKVHVYVQKELLPLMVLLYCKSVTPFYRHKEYTSYQNYILKDLERTIDTELYETIQQDFDLEESQ